MIQKKTSILIIKSSLSKMGGLEKYAYQTLLAAHNLGWNATLLTSGELAAIKIPPDVRVHKFPLFGPSWLQTQRFDTQCRKFVSKHSFDIVLSLDRTTKQTFIRAGNGTHQSYLAIRKKFSSPLKRLSFLINPLHKLYLSIEKKGFEDPNLQGVICNSKMVKEQILNQYAIDENKIHIIHNGVEWEEMEKPFSLWEEKRSQLEKRYKIAPHAIHFLFIGNGYERKGLLPLLKALSKLERNDFFLSIVGKENHINRYQKMIDTYGLQERVHIFGPQKDMIPFYQMADVLLIPSYYDPFANVTVEALAMGLYVLSSKSNGGSEILTSKTGAIIEDLNDINSIKLCLEKAYLHKKTQNSAISIRNSIKELDFSNQLKKMLYVMLDAYEKGKNFLPPR